MSILTSRKWTAILTSACLFMVALASPQTVKAQGGATATAQPAPQQAEPAPQPQSPEAQRKVRVKVAPLYPELAKKMNVSGAVKIQVVVAPNGIVKNIKVVGGHPLLIDSAVDAVRKWKYAPAATESTLVVEFKFTPSQ